MSVRVVNLTGHEIKVFDEEDRVLACFPPSGQVARLEELLGGLDDLLVDGQPVPTSAVSYADRVLCLPDPVPGVVYLVSRVLAAAVEREDLFFPGGEVRDRAGSIVGCTYLGRFERSRVDA